MPVPIDPPIITRAEVLKAPSDEVVQAYYPPKAWDQGLQGMVEVDCRISVQGVASDCIATEDAYPGLGFAKASVRLATQYRLKPATQNGRPVESRASFWIFWSQRYGEHPMAFRAPGMTMVPDAYPFDALVARRGGHAVLECLLAPDRTLKACRVVSEGNPADGFAVAALRFVPNFELRSCAPAGVLEPVRISFYWWPPNGPGQTPFTQIGYNKRFVSVITGQPVDRSAC